MQAKGQEARRGVLVQLAAGTWSMAVGRSTVGTSLATRGSWLLGHAASGNPGSLSKMTSSHRAPSSAPCPLPACPGTCSVRTTS